jgi:DNA repair exonuclease SbcCD ATPase subunit
VEEAVMKNDDPVVEAQFLEVPVSEDAAVQAEEGNLLSLNQVAEALGVSNPTARRLCMSGRLQAVKLLVNEQLCWKVKPDALKAYQEALSAEAASDDVSRTIRQKGRFKEASEGDRPFTNPPSTDFPMEAHMAALETARRALERLERIEGQLEQQRDRVEQQRARADQAERQKFALEMELRQYQAALSEQSESLSELRAEKLAAEMHLKALAAPEPMPAADLQLRIATPRPTFGQRVRSWLGFSKVQNS